MIVPTTTTRTVLTINGGSSSIRFALFDASSSMVRTLQGKIERIGVAGTNLTVEDPASGKIALRRELAAATDRRSAADAMLDWLAGQQLAAGVAVAGHRVVHGMRHSSPQRVTPELLDDLRRLAPYDPDHLPGEIDLIESLQRRHPRLPQVACFDTAFHGGMPRIASLLPIPRRYNAEGVRRYGFHGLSYGYLMQELGRVGDPAAASGRVILAHLGNGASMAAVLNGRSVDTSMAFTPAAGLPMGTRSGDLDPGLAGYFARAHGMSAAAFGSMVNHDSGLLGLSETSSDVRDLLAAEAADVRAAEALAVFCYQVKKWIGAYAAALGGLDALVFAGGIGENAPVIRARICSGLEFLGVQLHAGRNDGNEQLISDDRASVRVRVLRTDEELMIARLCIGVLDGAQAERARSPRSEER